MKISQIKYMAAAICVFFSVCFTGCAAENTSNSEKPTKTGILMDTVVTVTLFEGGSDKDVNAAFDEITRLEALLSISVESSDVCRINAEAGRSAVKVSQETLEIIEKAIYYSEVTSGYFDVSAGPLIDLWDISGGGYFPTREEKEDAVRLIDWKNIQIDNDTVFLKDENMQLNLGAIAKGYIADSVKALLLERGVNSAIIDLGGNVLAVGEKPGNTPFKIGIRDPRGENGELFAVVNANDISIVTSGDYERYFERDGVRYHHILDPYTGEPSRSGISAVTVITENSVDGDALSTSLFLLGAEEGLELVEKIENTECLFVTVDGEIIMSSGMKEHVEIL